MKTINLYELKKLQTNFPAKKLTNSNDGAEFIRQFFSDDIEIFESFFMLMLNRNNNTIGYCKISQGGIAGTYVDIKLICKYAVDSLCSAVIICHNHPSGNLKPSEADKQMTDKIKNALSVLEINLFDHLILTINNYYSFADNGEI